MMTHKSVARKLVSKVNVLFIVALVAGLALVAGPMSRAAASTTVTVKPSALNGWSFLLESGAGAGDFVVGPATAPLGQGSAHLTTSSSDGGILIGAALYAGTRLGSITNLEYSTYQSMSSSSTVQAISLQFSIDNDVTDGDNDWKGRLVFEPYYTETIVKGGWQTWDPQTQGKWWGTGATISAFCSIGSPCTWAQVLSNFPNVGIHSVFGAVLFKAGSGWPAGFDGNVDAFTIGVGVTDTTYDFDPETPCTTVCYVDATTGNDSFGGDTPASAKKSIQAAIDAVDPGGMVRVLPGSYSETATNRWVLGTNGPHQFGLFIGSDKNGISIIGVDNSDTPITDYNSVAAHVTTNATNNFGYSGIFVEGDDVKIQGLRIGPNAAGDNKTIEVIGDNFTLKDSHIDVPGGGSVYFNDWQFDAGTDTSHVQSYTVNHNWLDHGTSVDLSSGAGYSGPVSGRQITNNKFTLDGAWWNAISFNGSGTGVPWFMHEVGGAIMTGNDFSGGSLQYIRVRGDYDNSQFDWASYWNDNSYDKAVVVGTMPPGDVREFSYTSGPYTFLHVRRIGATIQGEVDNGVAGDTVLVKAGMYPEQVVVDKTLKLAGESGPLATFIQAPSSIPPASNPDSAIVKIMGAGVDVEMYGFTVTGPGPSGCGSIGAGIFVRDGAHASIYDNRILDIRDNDPSGDAPFSGCQNGVGILVGRNFLNTSGSATIVNNLVEGYQKGGVVVDNTGSSADITGNTVTGYGPTVEIAQNGIQISRGATALVQGNTVSGNNYPPISWVACGLLYYQADGVRASGNTKFDNERDQCNFGKGGGNYNPSP